MSKASPLRHGFKAEADRTAARVREELGLGLPDRLDPVALATHLGIEVMHLTGLHAVCPEDVEHLTQTDLWAFSGTLIERDGRRAIFVNDAHPAGRQASTIGHECSHLILGHEPDAHFAELGIRRFDERIEREADWLSDCLLVPTKAVLPVVRQTGGLLAAADHFGVSEQLMQKRWNLSGAKAIAERQERARR